MQRFYYDIIDCGEIIQSQLMEEESAEKALQAAGIALLIFPDPVYERRDFRADIRARRAATAVSWCGPQELWKKRPLGPSKDLRL